MEGRLPPKDELETLFFDSFLAKYPYQKSYMSIPAIKPDQKSLENECKSKKLKKVCIFQLRRDHIDKDTVLWVKISKVQIL